MRTPEQAALAEMVSGWLADHVDLEDARSQRVAPPSLKGVAELGLLDILLPGEEATLADLVVVQQALAAASAPFPVAEVALARGFLAELGAADPGTVLPVCPPVAGTPLSVVRSGDSWQVTGRVEASVWCETPDRLLVPVTDADGRSCFAEVDVAEVGVRQRTVLDLTRAFALVELDEARASVLHQSDRTGDLRDAMTLLCVADALGAAERALLLTLEHVRSREQFGQLVGSFQAVKHHCASMRAELVSALAALDAAVASWGSSDSPRLTAVAAAHCLPASNRITSLALQLHGGMGFTWEHDLHLLLRRVKTDELLSGTPREHLDRVLTLL